ncbi:MFS transporter [Nitratireductor soli]|uniref:MFS transporter n=1 Tax=Nitratireductor soli TaxID=1670619 RepID=UPI0009E214B6
MKTIRLPFLFLIAFLVGADEFLLGPILTPIGEELGVAPERVTLFIAAYSLPLALLAPVFGHLSDRYGRLAVLLPATVVFAAGSILTGLVSSFEWGLATRVLTGAASAGMLPVAFALAADEGRGQAAIQQKCGAITSEVIGSIHQSRHGALAMPAVGFASAKGHLSCKPMPSRTCATSRWGLPSSSISKGSTGRSNPSAGTSSSMAACRR